MNPTLISILAVIAGWGGGSVVNMVLIQIGYSLYPIEGIDLNNMEALAEIMPTLGKEHLIFPFMANALGTLVGVSASAVTLVNTCKRQRLKPIPTVESIYK